MQNRQYTIDTPAQLATNKYYLTGLYRKTSGARVYPVEYTFDYAGRLGTMTTWQDYGTSAGAAVTQWKYEGTRGFLTNKVYLGTSIDEAFDAFGESRHGFRFILLPKLNRRERNTELFGQFCLGKPLSYASDTQSLAKGDRIGGERLSQQKILVLRSLCGSYGSMAITQQHQSVVAAKDSLAPDCSALWAFSLRSSSFRLFPNGSSVASRAPGR